MSVRPAEPAVVPPRPTLSVSARWWIWGLPIVFLLHDAEEAIVTVRAGQLRSIGSPLTVSQGLAAILFEAGLFWLVAVLAVWSGRPGWPMRVFGMALCGYTLHGVGHLVVAFATTGYTFGANSAFPTVVVFGCLALWRLRAEGLLSRSEVIGGFLASVILLAPFLPVVHQIGRLIG